MRGKVWLAMTLVVLLGLGLHMFISSLRFEKLNRDYWREKQLRELETLSGMSSWIFDQGINNDEKKLLTDSSKSGKTWLWKVREDSSFTDIYYVFEPTVAWSNTTDPPLDMVSVQKAVKQGHVAMWCDCEGHRVVTISGFMHVLQYAIPLSEIATQRRMFWIESLTSAAISVLLGIVLAGIVGDALTRPLTNLARRVRNLESTSALPGLERKDEVGILANALQEGLDDLREVRAREQHFLASASHELRTPVSALVVGLEQDLTGSHPPQSREALQRAHQTALRLRDLSSNLLTLTRAGQAVTASLNVDLLELCSQVVDELMPLAVEKGLMIELKGKRVHVMGDPSALRQLVANLLGNAIKFTDKGEIEVWVGVANKQIELRVSDTGIGLPQGDTSELLEPFKRGGALAQRQFGSGLGLTVVNEVASIHNANLSLERRTPRGTTVRVIFGGVYETVAA
jgi:signal transduction histidine kinase